MRAAIVLALVVAGCRSSGAAAEEPEQVAPIARLDLPRMDESAHVLVLANAKPAALVWVGANGTIAIVAGAKWNGDVTPPARNPAPDKLRKSVLQVIADGGGLRASEAKSILAAENDYGIARQRVMRRARPRNGGPDVPGMRLSAADAIAIDKLERLAPLVIATPSAPAIGVARLLRETGGALAVDHLGKLAVLTTAFELERDRPPAGSGSWLELAVDAKGVHLVTRPDDRDQVVPWAGAMIDRAGLAAAYRRAGGTLPIDVVVREDTTMQTLVDVLAALHAIDARQVAIAIGKNPAVSLGSFTSQGDLDKTAIQKTMQDNVAKLQACYEKELVAKPTLAGTVQTQFFITAAGNVASASASGVDPVVAACVANVIRGLVFPKPTGGGGVQVNYPLLFQS